MPTMVVTMTTDPGRRQDVVTHLQRDVAPWAARQGGFVSGQWLCTPDGEHGLGVITFATTADVEAAAQGPRAYQRDETRAWNVVRVEVFDQVAQATAS